MSHVSLCLPDQFHLLSVFYMYPILLYTPFLLPAIPSKTTFLNFSHTLTDKILQDLKCSSISYKKLTLTHSIKTRSSLLCTSITPELCLYAGKNRRQQEKRKAICEMDGLHKSSIGVSLQELSC